MTEQFIMRVEVQLKAENEREAREKLIKQLSKITDGVDNWVIFEVERK